MKEMTEREKASAFCSVMVAKALLVLAVAVEQQPFVLLPALLEQRKANDGSQPRLLW